MRANLAKWIGASQTKKHDEPTVVEQLFPPGTVGAGSPENVKVGKNCSFGGNVMLFACAPIEIGDNTMIAMNVVLHTSSHEIDKHPMWTRRIDRPIKVGKHVWIGVGAIILPGIIIDDYAVIGAGSVVTANVPEGAVVAGNPARIIKYRDPSIYLGDPEIDDINLAVAHRLGYHNRDCKTLDQRPL